MTLSLGDHSLRLSDGRALGYSVYGDPNGSPVVNCHGGLVSGHDVAPADADARALALCIISPDRPGVGRTDRLVGHTTLSWVNSDLVPLLDHLEVDRFAVMGWSEGGQFALAAAFALAGRAVRCAVLAGCLPLDDPATVKQTNRLDRSLIRLSRTRPVVVRCYFAMTRVLSKHAPTLLLRAAVRGLPRDEAEAVAGLGRWFPTLLGEGATDSRGGVDEYLAMSAPWEFDPEDVTVPVRIFQGSADALVPEAWGDELARRIPGATITRYPDEGHFIAFTRRRDVLEYLGASGLRSNR
jgi:pimeloyl-ACP methyl ester carboxylesterase